MAYVDWLIDGPSVSTCNCDWGCPCQFNSVPSSGDCRAAFAFHIDRGHFGDVDLSGLRAGAMVAWPGAIHEGHGECQPIVDAGANANQRDALLKIMSGEETDPGATIFAVFASTYTTVHEPQFLPIDFEEDMAAGTGRFMVPGMVSADTAPIANPVSGAPHRVRVALQDGFEYTEAEYVNSKVRAETPIALNWDVGHGHICRLHLNGQGVIRD